MHDYVRYLSLTCALVGSDELTIPHGLLFLCNLDSPSLGASKQHETEKVARYMHRSVYGLLIIE